MDSFPGTLSRKRSRCDDDDDEEMSMSFGGFFDDSRKVGHDRSAADVE
jgi:hypothetical protein